MCPDINRLKNPPVTETKTRKVVLIGEWQLVQLREWEGVAIGKELGGEKSSVEGYMKV